MFASMFARHFSLHNFGKEKQEKLATSHVCVVGCGGLGHAAAMQLVCSGVGTITLFDGDTIDESNLHRQTSYTLDSIGKSKVETLAYELSRRRNDVVIHTHNTEFSEEYISELLQADVILDCTDNAKTRLLLNTICVKHAKPLVFGSAIGWDGQLLVITPNSPCLSCVFPEMKNITDRCENRGVFGPVPNIIGIMQAIECIKLLVNTQHFHDNRAGKLYLYSALTNGHSVVEFEKDESCEVCGVSCKGESNVSKIVEVTYEDYLADSRPKQLLDIRFTLDDEEEILGAKRCTEEQAIKIREESSHVTYILCEYGERSYHLAIKIVAKSIKGGSRSLF
jgi:molybdopterin/thiamine biosynthesis adenylyltransferase